MKPKNIFLVRHGESEGNVDYRLYGQKPDYRLLLTEKGKKQAIEAGEKLFKLIDNRTVFFYVSPLWRTRMTFEGIAQSFSDDLNKLKWFEEPRIREQEWGHLRSQEECDRVDKERNEFGSFYYRIPDGESCADVFDRMSDFFNTLHRDFQKEDFPENCVLITHGTAIKCFLMKWFHWTVEEFESVKNPKNCEIFQMTLQENNKYKLVTELKKKKLYPQLISENVFLNNPKPEFEILRIRRSWIDKREEGFLFSKKEIYFHNLELFTKEDSEFEKLLKKIKNINNIYCDYKIDCVKRNSDGQVFKFGDEVLVEDKLLKINYFYLDGFNYIRSYFLKSQSGIQADFGGGEFIDINQLKKYHGI